MSLKIIGGDFRGKRLVSPAGRLVRPTAGRVREALFAILSPVLPGATVLDLFAGSGAMGLEALSRGAAKAVFIETAPAALTAIKKNIDACHLHDRTRVRSQDATGDLSDLKPLVSKRSNGPEGKFDLVFLDPPYRCGFARPALTSLAHSKILTPGATIIMEHCRHEPIDEKVRTVLGMQLTDRRRYGKTLVSFMKYTVDSGKTENNR